jgi:hypothetical protein
MERKELPTTGERAERCETCRFWWNPEGDHLEDTDEPWGHCRRYPPVVLNPEEFYRSESHDFPISMGFMWCGEWQPLRDTGEPT